MKPYTVVWDEAAVDELASIWDADADRRRVTRAAAQIDNLLKATGRQAGLELAEGLRTLTVLPLRIVFIANPVIVS